MQQVEFVLASKSAIRATLLRNAGLTIRLEPAAIDERGLEATWTGENVAAESVAERLAREKALDVSRRQAGAVVIGADQTLAVEGDRLSKVSTRVEAGRQIARLSGRTHALHSGFAVARDGKVLASGVSTARLAMRALSAGDVEAYLDAAGDSILGSVGCYQLEGLGVRLFSRIEGDYFTVLGLPLLDLLASLRRLDLLGAP